jgi:DNA-binding transcriptional regulator YiaG
MSRAEQIKAVRLRLKESQAVFAARFGVDQSVISRWEAKGPPSRGTAQIAIDHLLEQLEAAE